MIDDPDSDGDDAPARAGPNVRRRGLLAGAGALAFGAAVPGVGAAASGGSDPPRVAWQRRYGGDGPDSADALVRTSRGGYALAGHNPTDPDAPGHGGLWIADLDADGDVIWERALGDLSGSSAALAEGPSGALVVAGREWDSSNGGAAVVNLGATGETLWRTRFPVPERYQYIGEYYPSEIIRASDGGYVVAGTLQHNEGSVAWVAKVAADGEASWSRLIEVSLPEWFWPVSSANGLARVADGEYAVGGAAAVGLTDGEFDLRPWVAKVTADGDVTWDRTYLDEYGEIEAVVSHDDETVLGGGTVEGPVIGPFEYTPVLLWVDARGGVERVRTHPETPVSVDSLVPSVDGDGYTFAGEGPGGGWGVVGVDRCGNPRWSVVEDDPVAVRALVGSDAGYAIAGTTAEHDESDGWVAELTTDADVNAE